MEFRWHASMGKVIVVTLLTIQLVKARFNFDILDARQTSTITQQQANGLHSTRQDIRDRHEKTTISQIISGMKNMILPKNNEEKETDISVTQPYSHLKNLKVSDLKEHEFESIFFDREYEKDTKERMEFVKQTLTSISKARKELDPTNPTSLSSLENWLTNEIPPDEIFRGLLSHIFDQKKKPQFNQIKHLGQRLKHEEQKTWDKFWKLVENEYQYEDNTKGYFGYFYYFWKYMFDHSNWKTQELKRFLRKIRMQLRWRKLTDEERIILKLGKVQNAGLMISENEWQLAKKISQLSETNSNIALSKDEEDLLEDIDRRTVVTRRREKLQETLDEFEKFEKGGHIGYIELRELDIICAALKELISKTRQGFFWTEFDQKFMIDSASAVKKLRKKNRKLHQLTKNLSLQKALNYWEAKAGQTMDMATADKYIKWSNQFPEYTTLPLDYLLSHFEDLERNLLDLAALYHPPELNAEDIGWARAWAGEYFRVRNQLNAPIHVDAMDFANNKLLYMMFSKEKQAIQALQLMKENDSLDDEQNLLLEKLENYIEAGKLRATRDDWVEAYEKQIMRLPPSVKAQLLNEALKGTPELNLIKHLDENARANFYDEVHYSRPMVEWWMEAALMEKSKTKQPLSKKIEEKLAMCESRCFDFQERCKITIHSKTLSRDGSTIEDQALQRLEVLKQELTLDPRMHDPKMLVILESLKTKEFGKILLEQSTVNKLAVEDALIKEWKVSSSDQRAASRLTQDIKLNEIDGFHFGWRKFDFLLPKEWVEIANILSLEDDDEKFELVNKYCQVLDVMLRASDRAHWEKILMYYDKPANLMQWEMRLHSAQKEKILKERQILDKFNKRIQEIISDDRTHENN